MSFTNKTWYDPINIDSNNLNRIEQGVKTSFDNIEILKEELLHLQLNTSDLDSKVNTLIADSPNILNSIIDIKDLLDNNLNILDTLKDTSNLLTKTQQTLTQKETQQIYKNLGLNKFLQLTDIRVNDTSVINGSEAIIKINSPDTELNLNSSNSVANKTITEALNNLKTSIKYEDIIDAPDKTELLNHLHDNRYSKLEHYHNTLYSKLDHTHKEYSNINHTHSDLLTLIKGIQDEFKESLENLDTDSNYATIEYVDNNSGKIDKIFINNSLLPIVNKSINITIPKDLKDFINSPGFISEKYAKTYIDTSINRLINGAPTTLDTLKELADALNNNNSLVQLLHNSIGNKADKSHTHTTSDITDITELAAKEHSHSYIDIIDLDSVLNNYASIDHTHSSYALNSHTHTQTEINGLTTAINNILPSANKYTDEEITKLSEEITKDFEHNHDEVYLNKTTGGTLTGNLILQNGIKLQALDSTATIIDILTLTPSNSILLGDGYNQIDISNIANKVHTHTKSEITDFNHTHDYLPLTAGSTKPLTDDLYITSGKYIRLGNHAFIRGDDTDGRLTISAGKDRILTIRPNPDNSTGQMHIYGTVFRPGSKDGVQLGTDSQPWSSIYGTSIYGTTIYQNGNQVLDVSGGTMSGPLILTGGDAATGVGNIQLDTNGQIIAKGTTATLFGRNSATSLLVGHSTHKLSIRGSETRPTYNGNNMALFSDIPTDYAVSLHKHTKSDITDFAHTHTKSEITDFAHTHNYLPLTGGTITGSITSSEDMYLKSTTGVIRFGDSNDVSSLAVLARNNVNNYFRPGVDNVQDLGTSTQRWKNLYTSGTIYEGGTALSSKYLPLTGGTITASSTITMGGTSNSTGAKLKWGTVNSKTPYIGYATDQTDGTFVIGSLLGTNYATGLAISGGSGNLLWKGGRVATISDIPTNHVDTSSNQSIAGTKTFTGSVVVPDVTIS